MAQLKVSTGTILSRSMTKRPNFAEEAAAVLALIESDFGQSGRDVQYEAIRCELEAAYRRGLKHHETPNI